MGQSAVVEVQMEEALFSSAHAALVFAFNFSGQSYDRPMMNRMATASTGSGKGLVGLDGAGQAGMIRAEVKSMGKLAEAILIARIAPRTTPCSCRASCCSGHKPNKEWTDAISFLSDHVRTTALAGCTANGLLRRECVIRYFTRKDDRRSIEAIAEEHDIARNTVSAHARKVSFCFGGAPGRKGQSAVPGLEDAAMAAIDDRLREIGLVGA
jgi:hypothetical protein